MERVKKLQEEMYEAGRTLSEGKYKLKEMLRGCFDFAVSVSFNPARGGFVGVYVDDGFAHLDDVIKLIEDSGGFVKDKDSLRRIYARNIQ